MSTEKTLKKESATKAPAPVESALVLRPVDCAEFDTVIAVSQSETTLGSSEECDIPIPLPDVDAHHATILNCQQEWTLKSHAKQTWLNGKTIEFSDLKHGDRLRIGTVEFEVDLNSQSPQSKSTVEKRKEESKTVQTEHGNEVGKTSEDENNASIRSAQGMKKSPDLEEYSQDEIAESPVSMKSLKDELELERHLLREEREKVAVERQQLQEGYAAITRAREAIKTRERLLEEGERNSINRSASHSDPSVRSLYRKSEEEKLSDLRAELADKFEVELNDEQNVLKQTDSTEYLPEFSDRDIQEMESAESLPQQDAFSSQDSNRPVETDDLKKEDVSVQEYMQSLLERSRQGISNDPTNQNYRTEGSTKGQRSQTGHRQQKNDSAQSESQSETASFDSEDSETQLRPKLDKQSVRADLRTMRELANISARSAIASHFTKKLRISIYLKLVLSVVSFSIAVAIFYMSNYGINVATVLQTGAAAIGAISLAEVLRSFSQAQNSIMNDVDDSLSDEDIDSDIEFEINDSAILSSPELMAENYESESDRLDRDELNSPTDSEQDEDSDGDNEETAGFDKETVMEIPDDLA